MKKLIRSIFAVLFLFAAQGISAEEIQKGHSGSWWNSSQNGHGFSIEVFDDNVMVIYWYVFNPDGTSTFLVTVAAITGDRASGKTYYYSGMKFGDFNPSTLNEDEWGTVTIRFHSCGTATLNYSSQMSHGGVPFGSGTISLTKLLPVKGLHCTDFAPHDNYIASLLTPDGAGVGTAMVFSNGYFTYFAGGEYGAEVGIGSMTLTGRHTLSYSARGYDMIDGGYTDFSGTGEVNDNGLLINFPNNGTAFAIRLDTFHDWLSIDDLVGDHRVVDLVAEMQVATINIADNGQVTGQTIFGCNLVGEAWVPDSRFNQFAIEVDETNCSDPVSILAVGILNHDTGISTLIGDDGTFGYAWQMD